MLRQENVNATATRNGNNTRDSAPLQLTPHSAGSALHQPPHLAQGELLGSKHVRVAVHPHGEAKMQDEGVGQKAGHGYAQLLVELRQHDKAHIWKSKQRCRRRACDAYITDGDTSIPTP